MKFDIIGALDRAETELGHQVSINWSKSEDAYLVQVKVLVDPNKVYGQQIAFTDHEVMMDEWYIMNEKFQNALQALKLQIDV